MSSQGGLPELARHSRLPTTFQKDKHFRVITIHTRSWHRREEWVRDEMIRSGGYGVVWLERREHSGFNSLEFRAVKEMRNHTPMSDRTEYVRELEALAYFSQDKVDLAPFVSYESRI